MTKDKYLKAYLKENFDFQYLKKAGFFPDEIKSTDYEKQAERICHFFGLKNIYEYSVRKAVHLIHPVGIATGVLKNQFGEDILRVINDKNP